MSGQAGQPPGDMPALARPAEENAKHDENIETTEVLDRERGAPAPFSEPASDPRLGQTYPELDSLRTSDPWSRERGFRGREPPHAEPQQEQQPSWQQQQQQWWT